MKEPLLGVIGLRVRADTYFKYMSLPISRKREINNIMRATLEALIQDQQQQQGQQPQQQEIKISLSYSLDIEDKKLEIIKRLEKCRQELADYKMKAIELEEELQAKTKQLEELKANNQPLQKQLEELKAKLEELRRDKSNLEELAQAVYYCLQNKDCNEDMLKSTITNRLRYKPEAPPKLYTHILKVRS